MSFVDIADLDRLPIDRGVAAIVGSDYVAVFRLACGEVVAIDHIDPFTTVPALARGLVGSVGDRAVVASPLHKQRFDLRSGACIDDPTTSVRVWPTAVIDGTHIPTASPKHEKGTVAAIASTKQAAQRPGESIRAATIFPRWQS